ncbi:hypothetical protein Hypma_006542 [Hypsizygus marmoreus]|uniref:F-box domain-containing protein n=1 Tax=Hypsizygus marmoreus TaxID=39966 RepID=A0A369K5A0_HYPMA|nr:hypothetical protein Hypma_006542 [Hypsizygus marmoreus]
MFLSLPEDIHLTICAYLPPDALLALKQTCRVLHAFGCMDYVWHQMRVDLPLDLPLNQKTNNLRADQIQPLVIKALRVERNWQGHPGRPRHLKRIQHDGVVNQMQTLGSKWLVTLSRSRGCARLSVWSVDDAICYRTFKMQDASKFSAALHSESSATIAVIEFDGSDREKLSIYSLSLLLTESGTFNPSICHSISRPRVYGTFFDVQVFENLVATTIARFSDAISPPTFEILFINTTTHAQWLFSPQLPQEFERLRCKLFADKIVLIGVERNCTVAVQAYSLLPMMFCASEKLSDCNAITPIPLTLETEDIGARTTEEAIRFPSGFDFHLSANFTTKTSTNLPIIVFPAPLQAKGSGYMLDLPLGCIAAHTEVDRRLVQPFRTHPKASVDIICVGATGHRAVWLQRRWDTDEFELMKVSFSDSRAPKVAALLPRHLALPFEAHTCVSLAFDEATGRVCVGLHTGDLYILDF